MNLRQLGGLVHPSRSVYTIIQFTDRLLKLKRQQKDFCPCDRRFLQHLAIDVCRAASENRLIFCDLSNHDGEILDQHVPRLIKSLAEKYATAVLGHLVKQATEVKMGAAANRRNYSSRLTIFNSL